MTVLLLAALVAAAIWRGWPKGLRIGARPAPIHRRIGPAGSSRAAPSGAPRPHRPDQLSGRVRDHVRVRDGARIWV